MALLYAWWTKEIDLKFNKLCVMDCLCLYMFVLKGEIEGINAEPNDRKVSSTSQ